jgi:RNA 2',3'-cyclic 3'-phosphodiesterase
MKRTFIAVKIEPGEKLKETIGEIRDALKNDSIKWVDTGNMHITLAFLGDTDEESVQRVSGMLQEKCAGTGNINFTLARLGIFRNINDPRVIWAGMENSDKLVSLYNILKRGLEETGIKTEERDFNPHLTIGRIKAIKDKKKLESLLTDHKSADFQEVEISEIIFYESILGPAGPSYIPLCKVKL